MTPKRHYVKLFFLQGFTVQNTTDSPAPIVVAIFNQKGGSGKTTLAVHLAVAASMAGRKVCIIDLDPQGSATAWRRPRAYVMPVVAQVPASSLDKAIEGAIEDCFDFILIDTPPSVSAATARIIGAAGLVVVPVRPQPFDLAAVPDTLKLIGAKRYVFVLSDCPQKAPEIEITRIELLKLGKPVFGPLNNWRSMWRALITGQAISEFEPNSRAAKEIADVCKSILNELEPSDV